MDTDVAVARLLNGEMRGVVCGRGMPNSQLFVIAVACEPLITNSH